MRTITVLAKYNTALSLYVSLADAGTGNFRSSPTLAAGDVKCSQDGAAEADLGTLPAFDATNVRQVLVTVANTELDCARTRVLFADQTSPKEWDDLEVVIETYGHASAAHPNLGWLTGDPFVRLGAPAGASVSADIADLPTNAELATALGTADDAVLAAIAALNNLSEAGVRSAVGLASANLDTQLGDLPTNSELTTALGAADDVVLAAIAGLVFPSVGGIADAVWDELLSGHVVSGSAGEALSTASGGGGGATASEVWDLPLTGGDIAQSILLEIRNRLRSPYIR